MPASVKSVLLSPLYAAQLFTGYKSFDDNPILGSERLNKRGLHAGRVATAYRMAENRRARLQARIPEADRAEFAQNGFILKKNFLPDDVFARLRQEIDGLSAPARDMMQGDTVTRRIALEPKLLASMPATSAMLESDEWRNLMNYVASYDMHPVYYIQSILSQVREAKPDPQTSLHADTFHPNLKAWFFLHDVAEDEGPFVYVPGSHRATPRRLAWEKRKSLEITQGGDRLSRRGSLRIEQAQLKRLGYGEPQAFAVPANTLVVADTYGFHARGSSARPSVRIEIWAYGRRNPFLPWLGLDPWSLPGLKGRKAPLVWALDDALSKMGLGRQSWKDVGVLRPDSPSPLAR
jgi:hypothetical protein